MGERHRSDGGVYVAASEFAVSDAWSNLAKVFSMFNVQCKEPNRTQGAQARERIDLQEKRREAACLGEGEEPCFRQHGPEQTTGAF
ncbi:MAG: hypothetical protein ABIY47_12660 [Opitutaceae bacterium]